jgi:Flp pilus assembly protein TadB
MGEGFDTRILVGGAAALLALASGAMFVYFFVMSRRQPNLRNLMGAAGSSDQGAYNRERRAALQDDPTGKEYERLKTERRHLKVKKPKLTQEERFFQAGLFSDQEKKEFLRTKLLAPFVTVPLAIVGTWGSSIDMVAGSLVLAIVIGLQIPNSILDRKIKQRHEEIMFYLPLVIEQISIGVSSSLDIGPCLQRVVSMGDERDSHNVVTELIRHAQFFVKSGISLEDAMTEVGKLSGHVELKHAFMSLSQVAKHGGEISKQLQDLADAVGKQRESKIEEKIKKLELEATGPVALVFVGFIGTILIGFGIQIMKAF